MKQQNELKHIRTLSLQLCSYSVFMLAHIQSQHVLVRPCIFTDWKGQVATMEETVTFFYMLKIANIVMVQNFEVMSGDFNVLMKIMYRTESLSFVIINLKFLLSSPYTILKDLKESEFPLEHFSFVLHK